MGLYEAVPLAWRCVSKSGEEYCMVGSGTYSNQYRSRMVRVLRHTFAIPTANSKAHFIKKTRKRRGSHKELSASLTALHAAARRSCKLLQYKNATCRNSNARTKVRMASKLARSVVNSIHKSHIKSLASHAFTWHIFGHQVVQSSWLTFPRNNFDPWRQTTTGA